MHEVIHINRLIIHTHIVHTLLFNKTSSLKKLNQSKAHSDQYNV